MDRDTSNGNRQISLRKRFFSVPTLVSFTLALALLIFLVARFDLDWKTTWVNIRSSNPWFYLLAFVLYYLTFIFRGWRWQILARNAQVHTTPGGRLPSIFQCSQFILLGWFANTIAWFRLGDAYRALVFTEESKGEFPRVFGTVLAERVIDIILIFLLLLAGVFYLSVDRGLRPSSVFLIAPLVMVGASILLLLLMRHYGIRLSHLLPQRFQGIYERFHQGTLGSFKKLRGVFLLGLMAWGLEVARLFFVIQALGLDVDFSLVLFVALASALLTTVPITPGGLGIVEPGIVGLLMLSLPDRPDAVSVALVDRSISYASVVIFGGLLFLIRQVIRVRATRRTSMLAGLAGSTKKMS